MQCKNQVITKNVGGRFMNIKDMTELDYIKSRADGKSDSEKMMIYEQYKKSEVMGAVVNFFFPGVGHMILGKVGMGIAIFCAYLVSLVLCFFIIGFILLPIIVIWSIYDAYTYAKKYNENLYLTLYG
jgi:TM2 domain-containing membrane protein YozV